MKKVKLLFATLVISSALNITAFAGQWIQDTAGWWYQNDNGTYPINGLKKIDYNWYYFDAAGYMKTGWYQFANGWFGFSDSGNCLNPRDYYTDEPIGGPYEGWIEYSGSYESTVNDLANGSVVYYNNRYWSDPNAYQEEVVYDNDIAPEPVKNRFGLADMNFD